MMDWEYRLVRWTPVEFDDGRPIPVEMQETLVELREVYYTEGVLDGHTSPCLFSEDEAGARQIMAWVTTGAAKPVIDFDAIHAAKKLASTEKE